MDEKHFDAVVNRDWETAEKMVEEAAKKAGYTKTVYHGTDARFTRFDTDEESTAREQHAWMADYPDGTIFLAEDYDVADGYGERVMELYLDTSDMKVFEEPDMYAHRAMDDKYGYEVYNYPVIAVKGKDMTIYATLDNTLVKSADTVTYGDGGEIIPLSERFKHDNEDIRYSLSEVTEEQNQRGLDRKSEVSFSLSHDTDYMDKAIAKNNTMRRVDQGAMTTAKALRERIASRMNDIKDRGLVGLPEDIEGNTYIANSSYDGTEENTTICPRSLASEAFVDAVSEYLGRPLSVEEQIYISQDLQGRSMTPECTYCYVATDRKAYRAFLGEYVSQRDAVLQKVQDNPNADASRSGDLYREFLNGRKDTNPMYNRFKMWVDAYKNGKPMVDASHLANINKLMGDINSEFGAELKPQIVDAMKYAQSASWAKKRINYVAYNGHILNWKQDRINKLNSHYGLRMYSFSDFHPAFVLENMQMITDASVRGLKMLGYTKDTDFVDIFAPSGMNINVSTFGFEAGGNVYENNIIGAEWEKAKALREQYPNVGITFVATNDTLVDWALDQDWIDVVIPFHLVRTGKDVAKAFNYHDYTSESSDVKTKDWKKGDKKYIAPTEHNNDKATYLAALEKNHLKPRFERFIDRTNYMKLVNECRQPASESKPVQPVFNENAAMVALAKLEANGYYQPIGGSVDRMYEIAAEVAEDMTQQLAPAMSLSDSGKPFKRNINSVYGKDIVKQNPFPEIAPVVDPNNQPSKAWTVEEMFPDEPTRQTELNNLVQEKESLENQMLEMGNTGDFSNFDAINDRYVQVQGRIAELEGEISEAESARANSLNDPAPTYQSKDPSAVVGQTTMFEPPAPNPRVAEVLTKPSKKTAKESGVGLKAVSQLVDKGMVFENLSLDTGNMEVQSKWNYALPTNTEARAQHFMEHGADGVKPLKNIIREVTKSGKEQDFFEYMYHAHNVDRMSLEERFHVPNKSVYGETVTANESRSKVKQLEAKNPDFKAWAEEVYAINKQLREMLVGDGIISRETANLWEKMYPHYVPITRTDSKGLNVTVPLDTNKTGVNAPIKRATGGSSNIEPLFNTMAQRIEQTYRAIARNSFGIELKNTLGTTINSQQNTTGVDEMIDTIEAQEEKLLKPGTMNSNPTFTVFENGERVEFEITEDMFAAMKPADGLLGHRIEALNKMGNFRRNLLTVWNPVFALYRNPIKDIQDVGINSQHPLRTYLNVPNAIYQIATNGKYATEYHQNGGKSNTYFDSRTNTFKEDNIFKKTIGMPVRAIEAAGEFIEEIPRLAEYIASRQDGRSAERSMLDAARVTTNFAAGGDFTKFLNGHGFTFLNASVQGASQHVRNFREATKLDGMKGFTKTLAKYVVAGIPSLVLNGLLWDDDEEYEELSDYVKQNYYVVAKTEDGKFIRIPKGRTAAVMQNAFEQMEHLVTGDDEADFQTFFELFMNNIAPNNPIENNILAPIGQVLNNEAWYGGDLVPARLQDLPAEEQFDESTDAISKWLGEKTGTSPYKWNYLIDQYSGGAGDVFLPMMTPEAESGDDTFVGNLLAPWKKEITTDKVLNNKNPGDFYDLKDELEIKSNSSKATEEDTMRSMYMDSVSWEMSDLYKQKRAIQSSALSDSRKYEKVREIQEQINELAKNAVNSYNDIRIDGKYATVGDKRFDYSDYSGKWYEISGEYLEREQKAIERYGITPSDYWNNTDLYYHADWYFDDKYATVNREKVANMVFGGKRFAPYAAELGQIKGEDKNGDGKTDSGTKKDNVIDYINNSDLDFGERIITFKMSYPADDTYNYDIIDYLNGREDIDYQEMEMILKYLGFNVDSKGNITWD
jgi:hypothetical protein